MKQLPATAMRSNGASYLRATHHVRVTSETSYEDILRPNFWVHQSSFMNPDDLVDVVSDTMDVQLRVVSKGVGYVQMRVLRAWVSEAAKATEDTDEAPLTVPEGYDVKRGPGGRWRVFTKSPLMEVQGNIPTERAAIAAAIDHAAKANTVAA